MRQTEINPTLSESIIIQKSLPLSNVILKVITNPRQEKKKSLKEGFAIAIQ